MMKKRFQCLQLTMVALTLSACGGSSSNPDSEAPGTTSGIVDDGGTTGDGGGTTGGEVPEGNTTGDVDPAPAMLTSENAAFLNVPYTQARADLNNIVTGNLHPDGTGIENLFAFATNPAIIDNLASGESVDCVQGGSIDYLREAGGEPTAVGGVLFISRTLTYTNCALTDGLVDGVIEIRYDEVESGSSGSMKTLTTFDVSVSSAAIEATLKGQHLADRSSTFIFNPNCGENKTVTEIDSLTLDNSTISDMSESPIVHYYSVLNHVQTDTTETFCTTEPQASGESMSQAFASAATYTRTLADKITSYQVDKTGNLRSILVESDDIGELAKLVAEVQTAEPATHTLSIAANDVLGTPLNVVINSGDSTGAFIEELGFENLSN